MASETTLPLEIGRTADTAAVLLVDDDPRNLLALESILEGGNYDLVKAQSGNEALMALMEREFAVIVLDVQMPEVSGIELARLVKQRRSTRHIPIIFLTAHYREEEHAIQAYDVGAVDYLTKPLHPAVLRSKVDIFVDLFLKSRELAQLNRSLESEIAERRDAEERFRVVVEAAPNAMIVFDREGNIRLANPQAEKDFLGTQDELALSPIGSLLPGLEVPPRNDSVHEVFAARRDGSHFPADVTCRPIHSGEEPLFLASITDLSNERRTEEALRAKAEAEEANAAKDRFLAMLSHELRTPLTPIVLSISLLEKQRDLPASVREAISTIRRNVWVEARLIDDLLDLARIRSGKLTLQPRPVDAHAVLKEAMDICLGEVSQRGIQIVKHLGATSADLQADPSRLQQIFWNLLTNAAKFTPEGGTITVRTSNSPDGSELQVEVADDGIGIDPDKLDRIFDAFEQVVRNASAGLGLGLAICKALVELHGGKIEARSEGAGKGSVFLVRIPCTTARPVAEPRPQEEPSDCAKPRVLLVEDHEDTAEILRKLLADRGHEVRTASSVAECLIVAKEYEFDILLSDIGLPDGTGTELLGRLKSSAGRTIPAIAMSGFGMENDRERSREAGFAEHLTKPVDFAALQKAISRLSY